MSSVSVAAEHRLLQFTCCCFCPYYISRNREDQLGQEHRINCKALSVAKRCLVLTWFLRWATKAHLGTVRMQPVMAILCHLSWRAVEPNVQNKPNGALMFRRLCLWPKFTEIVQAALKLPSSLGQCSSQLHLALISLIRLWRDLQ